MWGHDAAIGDASRLPAGHARSARMSESTPAALRSAACRVMLTAVPRSCTTWSSASRGARPRRPPG
eukprot:11004402-Alexandrium_andersonii.AAC.1